MGFRGWVAETRDRLKSWNRKKSINNTTQLKTLKMLIQSL